MYIQIRNPPFSLKNLPAQPRLYSNKMIQKKSGMYKKKHCFFSWNPSQLHPAITHRLGLTPTLGHQNRNPSLHRYHPSLPHPTKIKTPKSKNRCHRYHPFPSCALNVSI